MNLSFFKKRRRIALILAGCAGAALLLILLWPEHRVPEPQYQGKTFSEWFEAYNQSRTRPGFKGRPEAVHAIQEIGTNALPFLLDQLQHETPVWKVTLQKLAPKLPSAIQATGTFKRLLEDPTARRADSVSSAFSILGSRAVPAGPELARLLNDKTRPQTAQRAWICAAIVGQSLLETKPPPPISRGQIYVYTNSVLRLVSTNRAAAREENPFAF